MMKRSLCILAAALIALPACAETAPAAGDAARGAALAVERCSACHAVGAEGESPVRNAPLFRELTRRLTMDELRVKLSDGLMIVHDEAVEMPLKRLEPQELEDFLAHLDSLAR